MTEPLCTATADHLSILNLEGEYARRWDTQDAEGWAALFSDRGVFRTIGVGKLASLHFESYSRSSVSLSFAIGANLCRSRHQPQRQHLLQHRHRLRYSSARRLLRGRYVRQGFKR